MELIVGGVFLLLLAISTGIYLSDRDGWNRTFKRVSQVTRASLEARSFKSLERVHTGEVESWEAAFTGKTSALDVLPAKKHEIIKHNYYETHMGPWPQWVCKCGASEYEIVIGRLRGHERVAVRKGRKHVRAAGKRDMMYDADRDFHF